MAQTTDAMSGVANYVAISTDGAAWTDVSGFGNYVSVSPSTRDKAETKTFDGDTVIMTYGKRNGLEATIRILYTEGTTPPFDTLRTAHETAGGGRLQVRYALKGNTAGNQQFTSGADSKITSFSFPTGDASSAESVMCEFVISTATITTADIATA